MRALSSSRRSITSTMRPAGAFGGATDRDEHGDRATASRRRARRRHEHARHAGAASPLEHDVAGVPRGAALVLQGLVVLVEHHDRGEIRHRRERRSARAPTTVAAGGRQRPVAREQRDRRRPPAAAAGSSRRPSSTEGRDDERVAIAGRRSAPREQVAAGGSRRTVRRPRRTPRRPRVGATAVGTTDAVRVRGRPGTIVGGEAARRHVARRPAHRHDAHRTARASRPAGRSPTP